MCTTSYISREYLKQDMSAANESEAKSHSYRESSLSEELIRGRG